MADWKGSAQANYSPAASMQVCRLEAGIEFAVTALLQNTLSPEFLPALRMLHMYIDFVCAHCMYLHIGDVALEWHCNNHNLRLF